MNEENIKVKRDDRIKSLSLTMRISPKLSAWLKKMDYSPTGIFMEAVKDLGFGKEEE